MELDEQFENIKRNIMNKAAQSAASQIKTKVESIKCDIHDKHPTIEVIWKNEKEFTIKASNICCDDLKKKINDYLHSLMKDK